MDKTFLLRKSLLALFVSLVILAQTSGVFARPGMRGPDGPHRGSQEIIAGHERYYYRDGRFYRPILFGLFKILIDTPPLGAVVTVLPVGYRVIVVEGVTYYYYGNVYFMVCPSGYVVVQAPLANPNVVVVSSVVVQPKEAPGETATINVPNSNGGYTPVTLVKQKDGYIGPQGEYYAGHPTVEQLKVLYGK